MSDSTEPFTCPVGSGSCLVLFQTYFSPVVTSDRSVPPSTAGLFVSEAAATPESTKSPLESSFGMFPVALATLWAKFDMSIDVVPILSHVPDAV